MMVQREETKQTNTHTLLRLHHMRRLGVDNNGGAPSVVVVSDMMVQREETKQTNTHTLLRHRQMQRLGVDNNGCRGGEV